MALLVNSGAPIVSTVVAGLGFVDLARCNDMSNGCDSNSGEYDRPTIRACGFTRGPEVGALIGRKYWLEVWPPRRKELPLQEI